MKFLIQWLLVLSTILNPLIANAALTDFDRQEISHKNWLAPYNSGFESGVVNWTASGGTLVSVTSGSNLLDGKASITWDASASGQTLSSKAITIEKGYYGQNCEAAIVAQVPSGTATHSVQAYDGTNILVTSTIVSSTLPRTNTINFPCPQSGTVLLRFYANADEPLIAADLSYLGLARNVGSTQLISEWTSFTPTLSTSGGGGVTLNATSKVDPNGKWRRNGDSLEFSVSFRNGSGGSATGSAGQVNINIGTPGGCVPDTSKVVTAVGGVRVDGYATTGTTTFVTGGVYWIAGDAFRVMPNGLSTHLSVSDLAASYGVAIDAKVPCAGWTAQTTTTIDAISKRGSAYYATGNATTTSGSAVAFNNASFSSPTLEGQALAPTTANDVGIRLANAPAGVYEVNAVGWFYAYRASGETGTNCAYNLYNGTSSRGESVAGAPNVAGVSTLDGIGALSGTFTLASAGTINVVLRGQRTSGTGTCYIDGPISISIKNVSQPSPAIVLANSVSTGANNGLRTESATFTCSGSSSIGTQLGGSTWLTSIGNISSGACAFVVPAGIFSGTPQCQATWTGGGSNSMVYTYLETSTGFSVGGVTDAGAASSSFTGKVMCVGPR